jgi:hypothetical protein
MRPQEAVLQWPILLSDSASPSCQVHIKTQLEEVDAVADILRPDCYGADVEVGLLDLVAWASKYRICGHGADSCGLGGREEGGGGVRAQLMWAWGRVGVERAVIWRG